LIVRSRQALEFTENYCFGSFFNSHAWFQQLISTIDHRPRQMVLDAP